MNSEPESLRVKKIFEKAIELTSTEERHGYVNATCNGDASLFSRVQTLLRAHFESDGSFLPGQPAWPLDVAASAERPGAIIGRYKLLQKIGEGGCGVVWMAEQEEPVRRRVALKIIKLGMDTRSVIARFEAERQALALMDHPNIAKVLDAGATDTGRPFFVMELVRGVRLTTYCDQQRLPIRERLELFIKVCRAIQHAHQKGIIHRDIKPSNILVTLHDGLPVPKVIDFGIAKATDHRLTDKTLFTQFDAFVGTPAYMSPEQAEMSGLDIDTRTDIYSLGVLLYELLIGVTPFDAQTLAKSGLDEMRRIIREEEPKRPSIRLNILAMKDATTVTNQRREKLPVLSVLLRGDLDWIVMKCLEKDRTRRYETANGLAADLTRYLNNETIVARPPTASYRLQKAVRRNKLAVAAGTAVFAALVLGVLAAAWQAVRARNAEAAALAELENARAALAFIEDDLLGQASPDRQPNPNLTVRELLNSASTSFAQRKSLPPKVEATIRRAFGSVYFDLGEYALAIRQLKQAFAWQRARFGPAHEDTLRTLHLLARTYWWNGDDYRSLELAREGWELSRNSRGATNVMTLNFLAAEAEASIYTEQGTTHAIGRRIIESLRVVSTALGDTDKLTFRLEMILGLHHHDRGKFVEAETLLTRAIEQQQGTLPDTDPLLLQTMATLARVLAAQEKYDGAEALFRRVLELRRSVLGPDHSMTVNVEIGLAMIHVKKGEYLEADQICARLLGLLADGRLVETRFVVRSLTDLVRHLRVRGQWQNVDGLAQAVLAAGARQFKDDALPLQVVSMEDEWGRSLIAQGRYAEAEPHFRRAVEIRRLHNNTHGRTFGSMSRLGYCLFKQGKELERAESLLKHAAQEFEGRWEQLPDHLRLEIAGSAWRRLAEFYDATGRSVEAAVYHQKVLDRENSEGKRLRMDETPLF